MFAVDLLHEFLVGVWKTTVTHLFRILHALGAAKVDAINSRYVLQAQPLS
jgi:hypothetical protein